MRTAIALILLLTIPTVAMCDLPSMTYVTEMDATNVKNSGDQTISGTKTYTSSPIVPTPPVPAW